ncbi:MAG: SgcJ/EcaC family oxidoreductase [Bryobacteraceae bacterium]
MRTADPRMLPTTEAMYRQLADEAVRLLVKRQTEAWNRNDAKGWAKNFTPDAHFINVRGDLVKGRAAIERIHAFIFAGPYKDSHCAVAIDSISYLGSNVAVVETSTEVTNFKGLPPGLVATSPGSLRTRLKLILVNGDEGWKIFAAQNTAIVPDSMPVV